MSVINYRAYHPLPPILPHEIRYLREKLGWSQAKMSQFLSKDKATISRWETGHFEPDQLTLGVLHDLWKQVFGSYAGPYKNMYLDNAKVVKPEPTKSKEILSLIGKALLIGGVAYFIAKGINITEQEENDT